MKRLLFVALTVMAIAAMTFSVAAAGNPFAKETSTKNGYSTWDADLINAEKTDISQTGAGVYVAVLDTGLVPNWSDYFPKARIATQLGTGFSQSVTFKVGKEPCEVDTTKGKLSQSTWVGSTGSTHGTHVTSTIIGYSYRSNSDAAGGFPLPPIQVRGIAPEVTIIPVKVLADYQVPALPKCEGGIPSTKVVFGTDEMVAAGINYVTKLAKAGYKPMVINMSLGGSELAPIEKTAIDNAVAAGVVIVAAAGNEGETGMHFPGAYAPVISAGSVGWTKEWLDPTTGLPRYRMWWLKDSSTGLLTPPLLAGTGEVADPTSVDDVYVSDFSSRQLAGQQLDVLAPGSWVRGPFAGDPGFSHLPWWSKGIGDLKGHNPGNFYYVGGTSMATPHVAAAAALLLQQRPTLTAGQIESILKSTALPMADTGSRDIWNNTVAATIEWDTSCPGDPDPIACNAVGTGVIQVDKALAAPTP